MSGRIREGSADEAILTLGHAARRGNLLGRDSQTLVGPRITKRACYNTDGWAALLPF